jgi:hypothetical protein
MFKSSFRTVVLFAFFSVVNVGACTDDEADCLVDASNYDQSCVVAEDCVIVTDGDLCSDCRCPRAVINRSGLSDFESDVAAAEPSPANTCDCDAFLEVECVAGECRGIPGSG